MSSASATAVNSGSDGLSFASSTAGGSVAGFDTVTTDGCAEGLVLAPPPAEGDCQDGLSSARSAVVSQNGTLTTGGCAEGLVLALPPAEGDCQDNMSNY